jgi:iron complex transport system ATP-binding protein
MDKSPQFEIDDISFNYGHAWAIRHLFLDIYPGRFYGILGPNGCGKTTLLDLMMRNRRAVSGRIRYRGREIKEYTKRDLAREIALVPQDFYINFPFTVGEIVFMGRHPYIPRFASASAQNIEIVEGVMEALRVKKFKDKFVTELSGGERQRVIFARALAQDTPVLLLDEGTSNMDIKHTLEILDIVAYSVEHKKRTVIAVFHNLNLASIYCQKLIFMKDGQVVAQGDTDKVLNEENIWDVFGVECNISFDPYSRSKQVVFRRGSF